MADTQTVVPLPEHLSHCGCRLAPTRHATTCAAAIAFDATPLHERPEYEEGRRFAAISWDFPLTIRGSISVEVDLDPEAIIRKRIDEYRSFEMERGYAEWEKPVVFLCSIIEEQLDFGGVYFGDRRLSRDHSFVDELRESWKPEQTRDLFERLNDDGPTRPLIDPNQTAFDV